MILDQNKRIGNCGAECLSLGYWKKLKSLHLQENQIRNIGLLSLSSMKK